MATWEDVGRIAARLPETGPGTAWNRPAWLVRGKWFVVDREPRPDAVDPVTGERMTDLIVLHVPDEETKQALAADDSGYFLTTPHFARARMILVHLDAIPVDELAEVVVDSWLVRAPRRLAPEYLRRLEEEGPE